LQDRINQQIITTLQLELNPQVKAALQTKGTESVAAHEAFLRGLRLFNVTNRSGRRWAAADSQVQQAFERAIALDPRYALPYAGLGLVYWQKFITEPDPGWKWKKNALQLAKISLALAENSLALRLHARQYLALDIIGTPGANLMAGNQYDLAVAELRRARALAPNDADTLADLADTLVFAGEAKEAGELMRHAMRLNPNFPTWYYRPAGIACYMNEQYPQAVQEFSDWYESEIIKSVSIPWLAAAHAQAGNLDKARQIVARVNSSDGLRRGVPPFLQTTYYYYPFKKKADIEHLIEGMRKAGWPDEDK
jgi:tetratricopeptide (TPR) repeat protein